MELLKYTEFLITNIRFLPKNKAKFIEIPTMYTNRLSNILFHALDQYLQHLAGMIKTVDAMKLLFICIKPATIMKLAYFEQQCFRNLITEGIEEFQLNKSTIGNDIYIILNIIRSDPDFFLVDDSSSRAAIRRYDAIKTILNNIIDNHRRQLLPKDDSFCKFCLNFQEYMSQKPEPPCEYSAPKSIRIGQQKTSVFKTSVVGAISAVDCAIKLGLYSPKRILKAGAWSGQASKQKLIARKFALDTLNLDNQKNLLWGSPRATLPQAEYSLVNYITHMDTAYCSWSGLHGVLTYELSSSAVRMYTLRIFSSGLKLLKTILLDPLFNVLNTSRHPVEVLSLEFLRVKPVDGSNKVTLACIVRNVHLMVVEVAGGRRVARYQGESEKITMAKPISDNNLLLCYENFVMHHLYFTGVYYPEVFMKIWLPDVALACCSLTLDTYALLHRDMGKTTIVRLSDKSVTMHEADIKVGQSFTCANAIVVVDVDDLLHMRADLNDPDTHRMTESAALGCSVVSWS